MRLSMVLSAVAEIKQEQGTGEREGGGQHTKELEDSDGSDLAEAMHAVHGLQIHERVPAVLHKDDDLGSTEIESQPAGAGGEEEDLRGVKAIRVEHHGSLSSFLSHSPPVHEDAEDAREQLREEVQHEVESFAMFCKNEAFLSPRRGEGSLGWGHWRWRVGGGRWLHDLIVTLLFFSLPLALLEVLRSLQRDGEGRELRERSPDLTKFLHRVLVTAYDLLIDQHTHQEAKLSALLQSELLTDSLFRAQDQVGMDADPFE
jgi:hypothetical protein